MTHGIQVSKKHRTNLSHKKRKYSRQRACGKIRYRDDVEAKRVLHIAQISDDTYVPVRAYECEECNGWHLTSHESY